MNMFTAILAVMVSASYGAPPDSEDKVGTARWMASNIDWGVLSTLSTRSEGAELGEAFGNPYAFADASTGVPYFYASDLDASMIDVFTSQKANPRASLAISEASLHNSSSSAVLDQCHIGTGIGDPENPVCSRLVLTGKMVKLELNSSEDLLARASLFKRHPSFHSLPADHGFYTAKLVVDGVWLIDYFGGAAIIPPETYLAANVSASLREMPFRTVPSSGMSPRTEVSTRPKPEQKVATARWMVKTLSWGFLSTKSSRTEGTMLGDAFGNPYSFAAVSGVPYIYASGLDASMIDMLADPMASFTLSEASLGGTSNSVAACEIGVGPLSDPENPPCARLVLTVRLSQLTANTTEYNSAQTALFERHPSFPNYPPGHRFFVAKLDVQHAWLVDFFGGAAIMSPAEYFAGNGSNVPRNFNLAGEAGWLTV